MKLVCISDTHTKEPSLPKGDILIHAGDATFRGNTQELVKFNSWLGTLKKKYKHILFVPGNHDRMFETNTELARALVFNATVLINESVEIEGFTFYGSPYTPAFNGWAFQLYSQEQEKRNWDKIPDNTDVLITHGPPMGTLDALKDGTHLGSVGLKTRFSEIKPMYHIFGHIHDGYGRSYSSINASICNEKYEAVNKPAVVVISKKI